VRAAHIHCGLKVRASADLGGAHSVTCAYIPGSSVSSGFRRSISIRIVRLVGSSATEMRVTRPRTSVFWHSEKSPSQLTRAG
jgi:hypothetical protein